MYDSKKIRKVRVWKRGFDVYERSVMFGEDDDDGFKHDHNSNSGGYLEAR